MRPSKPNQTQQLLVKINACKTTIQVNINIMPHKTKQTCLKENCSIKIMPVLVVLEMNIKNIPKQWK